MKRLSASVSRRSVLCNGLKLAGASAAALTGGIMFEGPRAFAATALGFQLSWIKSAQYSGYFSGIDQGFFSAAGLDVTFNSGGPNIDPIANVAAGRSAIGDRPVGSLVIAREKGIPVKVIGT